MSIALVVTRGFSNATLTGSIADVVVRGYSPGAAVAAEPDVDRGAGSGRKRPWWEDVYPLPEEAIEPVQTTVAPLAEAVDRAKVALAKAPVDKADTDRISGKLATLNRSIVNLKGRIDNATTLVQTERAIGEARKVAARIEGIQREVAKAAVERKARIQADDDQVMKIVERVIKDEETEMLRLIREKFDG